MSRTQLGFSMILSKLAGIFLHHPDMERPLPGHILLFCSMTISLFVKETAGEEFGIDSVGFQGGSDV